MSSEVANELTSKLIIDGTKIGWHRDRVEAWMRGERVAPITMDIAWSRRCNAACLSPESLVTMGDGSNKKMSAILAGDWVVSSDERGVLRKSLVLWSSQTALRKRLLAIRIADDVLRCTEDHLILTPSGWVEAGQLKVGNYAAQTVNRIGKGSETPEYAGMVGHQSESDNAARGKRRAIGGMESNTNILSRCSSGGKRSPYSHQQDEDSFGERTSGHIDTHEESSRRRKGAATRPTNRARESYAQESVTGQPPRFSPDDQSGKGSRQQKDARKQSYAQTGGRKEDGRYAVGKTSRRNVGADQGASRIRGIQETPNFGGRAQENFRAHENKQSDEESKDRGESYRNESQKWQQRNCIEAHETDVGGREDNIRTQAHGRGQENDQSKRSASVSSDRPTGVQVHGRLLVLADGNEEREVTEPGFRIDDRAGEDRCSTARSVLAQTATGRCASGDGRLFEQGLEGICALDGEQDFQETRGAGDKGSLGVVGWRKIESISDAGYSPVYDLECVPYHNFVADGIVVHNCSFCAAKTQASASPSLDIPREKALEFLDDAAEIGVKGISLISDGESTLVDYYAESIEYADKLGIKVGLGSNGIAFDRPLLERILPHVSYLRFNFSAGTRKRYSEIMGVKPAIYDKVRQNIRDAMDIVNSRGLECNVNMNLVCEPKDSDQLLPFAHMAKELGVHYAVIKHCATDDDGVIKVNYADYGALEGIFKECEALTDDTTRIAVKWNRLSGKREYTKCFGAPFILQMSGNGLIATCGPFFSEKYKAFHIGNIMRTRFRDIFQSERYWEVMRYIGSDDFNPQTRCPVNCLQTQTNKFLFDYKAGVIDLPTSPPPSDLAFI